MNKYINNIIKFAQNNKESVFMGIAIGSTIGAVVETYKHSKEIDSAIKEIKSGDKKKGLAALTKSLLPTLTMTALSATSVIAMYNESVKKVAALGSAYTAMQKTYNDYKDTVKEVAEKQTKKIDEALTKKQLENAPHRAEIVYDDNKVLCLDQASGRYFQSSVNDIDAAINTINNNLNMGECQSVNDFYYEIGLDNTKFGELMGWNAGTQVVLGKMSGLTNHDEPCLVIYFKTEPNPDYYHFA